MANQNDSYTCKDLDHDCDACRTNDWHSWLNCEQRQAMSGQGLPFDDYDPRDYARMTREMAG